MKSSILTILPHPDESPIASLPEPDTSSSPPSAEALPPSTRAAVNAAPSIESVILQKLLAELESRQLAPAQLVPAQLVPAKTTYVIEQSPQPRHTVLIRVLWSSLWALSLIVCTLSVKYLDSQSMIPKADANQSRSIENLTASIGDQKKEFSRIVDSLQGLANAIASNSRRTAQIPDILNKLGTDLAQGRSPVVRQRVDLDPQPAAPQIMHTSAMLPAEPDSAPIAMGGHRHPPIQFAVAQPDVVVHHNSLGFMDYWLVPRLVSGVRTMVEVVPVSQSSAGTLVHAVEEASDYLVTPAGEWIPESYPLSPNK